MQARVAEAAAFMGNRVHALAEAGTVSPGVRHLMGHGAAAHGFTRPPFAHPECLSKMDDQLPFPRGRNRFFSHEVLQRRVVQHGVGQEPLQLRLLLLLSHLAPETSIPLNLAFHL